MYDKLMPTMRLRWVDKAMNNVTTDTVLQQFWVYGYGCDLPGEWIDIPHVGHILTAPTNTLT